MKRIFLILIICSVSELTMAQSSAGAYGIYFEETFFPKYVNKNDTDSITGAPGVKEEKGLGYDTRTTLGYTFWNNSFLIGLGYNHYYLNTKQKNVVGGDPGRNETTKETEFGPTVGWFSGGFRTLLMFLVSGSKEKETINFDENGQTSNVKITQKKITGYQLTVGYSFKLWGVEIGPALVYKTREYKKQSKVDKLNPVNDYSNVNLYSANRYSEVSPMISIIARF